MGMSNLWMIDFERALEDFQEGKIDEATATARLKTLGLDPHEIQDHLHALEGSAS